VEDRFDEFEKRLGNLKGGADLDSINRLLSGYMKKEDFDAFLKRLEKCEKKAKKAKDMAKK
jgi:tetrahydromethanopterin S-methyltransferase subunit G